MGRGKFITGWMAKAGLGLATVMMCFSLCLAQHGNSHPAQSGHPSAPSSRPPAQNPPKQGRHAGDWLRQHQNMSPAERERALENDPGFRRLPPERQQQLRQRLQRFSSLPPQQQQRMVDNMDRWAHLTPEQKEQARQVHSQMQQLPPDRRRMVVTAVRDLSAMPPAEREQIINSPRFRSMFSPQELDIMRGASKLPLAPSENRPPE